MEMLEDIPEVRYFTIEKEYTLRSTCGLPAKIYILLDDELGEQRIKFLFIDMRQISHEFSQQEVVSSYHEFIKHVEVYLKPFGINLPSTKGHTDSIADKYQYSDEFSFYIERKSSGEYCVYTMT